MTTDDLFTALREWLRMHGDWNVVIELWSSFGTFRVVVTHLGQERWSDIGTDLGKRLDKALTFLSERST